jgi:CHAD domain-containing protein
MEAPPGPDREIEWQLEAQDLRLVLRWLENADTNGVAIAGGKTVNHVDTYLDTADRRLDRMGYSVRLRRTPRRATEATLKSLVEMGPDALRVRLEEAEEVEGDDPAAVAAAPGPVGRRVRALVGTRALVPLFDVQTRRRVFPLVAEGAPSGELVLDDTAIRDHGDKRILSRLRRVEVEVPERAVGTVGPLVETMRRALGLQPALLSKYEAALVASGSDRVEPESFGPTAITPDDTIGQVALAVLRRHFAVLLAKEPGTRLGDDIEELHDMRVASRRLRAALAFFADVLPADAARLSPELAWLGGEVGSVRDLDVQLHQLESDADLAPLRALLVEEREHARAELLRALDSPRYDRLVRRFGTMLRTRTGTRTEPARAAAPNLVEARHRALRKAMRRVRSNPVPASYHRLRIAGKRFRYAIEFVSDVYPGEAKPLVRRSVELQDLLGAHQDAYVAIEHLRALAETRGSELGPGTVFAMGELAQRYRSAAANGRGRVPAAYAKLEGKAWKGFRKRLEAERPVPSSASDDAPPPAAGG